MAFDTGRTVSTFVTSTSGGWRRRQLGRLVVSVHVGSDCRVGSRLFDLAQQHGLALTWGVERPAESPLAERILLSTLGHELALAVAKEWMAPSVSRRQFAREISRRVEAVRGIGGNIRTLLAYRKLTDRRLAMLPRTGIHGLVEPGRFLRPTMLKTLRLGLWTLPVTRTLPAARWSWLATWRVRAKLNQTAQLARTLHWRIDANRLGESRGGWRQIERSLALAGQLQMRGMLAIEPLATLIEQTYGTFDRPTLRAA